jgi:hypothetical protein
MIGSRIRGNRELTVLPRQGDQSKFDISEIASELAHLHGGEELLSVLFQWSQVTSWPFEAPSASAIRNWKRIAPPISRAALVHNQKLTRHAAVLAALMRVRDAEVRSFHPLAQEDATEWLAGGPQSPVFDGRGSHGDHKTG